MKDPFCKAKRIPGVSNSASTTKLFGFSKKSKKSSDKDLLKKVLV